MSSSTFSSDLRPVWPELRRTGLVVLVLVVCALLGLELFARTKLVSMSKDLRRFSTYGDRTRELVARPDGRRVLLVGNSATDRGIDLPTFEATLSAARGGPGHGALLVADQSRINTWHFMLERFVFRPGLRPDLVVVTFYENDLEDGNRVEIGRLAHFFTDVRDWPSVFMVDLPTLDQQADFVLSSFSAAFATRERVKERLLRVLIPRYESFTTDVNAVIFKHEAARVQKAPEAAPPGHVALDRLLARARQAGVRLAFVAYPTLTANGRLPYEIEPETRRRLEAAGAPLIDLRHVPGLDADLYDDEVHLNERGRPPYSAALARALAPLLTDPAASPPEAAAPVCAP
jgi:hypothetical protein